MVLHNVTMKLIKQLEQHFSFYTVKGTVIDVWD